MGANEAFHRPRKLQKCYATVREFKLNELNNVAGYLLGTKREPAWS